LAGMGPKGINSEKESWKKAVDGVGKVTRVKVTNLIVL
jgi:hypothetical protein